MNNVALSIVIPAFNAEKTIESCLRSIYASNYRKFEVIVVNDNSNDRTREIIAEFPCTIIDLNKNMGAAHARNVGVQMVNAEIIFFVDADVQVQVSSLNKLIETFDKHPALSAVIGSYTLKSSIDTFFSNYKNIIHHYTHQTSAVNTNIFWTGCGAIKKEVFEALSGFNEKYKNATVEDIELGYRLIEAGYKIYLNKDLQVSHSKKYDFFSLIRSDVFCRAIPWTKLILEYKKIKDDQDIRTSNITSIVVSYLLFINVFLMFIDKIYVFLLFVLLTVLGVVNKKLYRFVWKNMGTMFCCKFIVMHYLTNLYSGFGFVLGLYGYLKGKKK